MQGRGWGLACVRNYFRIFRRSSRGKKFNFRLVGEGCGVGGSNVVGFFFEFSDGLLAKGSFGG